MRLLLWLVVVVIVVAGVSLMWGAHRWREGTDDVRRALFAADTARSARTFVEADLAGVPVPVARYLRLVLPAGARRINRARVEWVGEFDMGKPGAPNWRPLTARQDYVVRPAGFVWDARIAVMPGLAAHVRDGFVGGKGSMLGRIAGLVTVVDKHDDAIAMAALQRHLGEAIWFPTALLPEEGVTWRAIDDTTAVATLESSGVRASAEFHFGADGLVESVLVPDRLFDNGRDAPAPHRWRARILGWGEHDAMRIPARAVAEWLFDAGPYEYWRGEPTAIAFDYGAR